MAKNRFRWVLRFGFFTFFIVAIGIVTALAPNSWAEEFAGEIVIGEDNAMTGPYVSSTFSHVAGGKDYWKHNNNRIKVNGKTYKVRHLQVDNKSDLSVTVSNYKRFAQDGALAMWTNWTPGSLALKGLSEKLHLPYVAAGFSQKVIDPPGNYAFSAQPSYPGSVCAGITWYKENVWKGPGKMKVGLLLWDNGYGRSSDIKAVYDYLREDVGVEVLPTQFFPLRTKSFTPQLLRFKEQGANLIVQQALAAQFAMLAKDAKRLGLRDKIALMANYWCISKKFIELAGDAADGVYGLWPYMVAPEDDNPSNPVVQEVRDCMEKYRGDRYWDPGYFQGWGYHHLMRHWIELAIKKHGFPVTTEQVAECVRSMEPWDWGLSRTFSGYKGGDRLGWHEQRVFTIKDGKILVASDWVPEPAGFVKRAPWIVGKKEIQ